MEVVGTILIVRHKERLNVILNSFSEKQKSPGAVQSQTGSPEVMR